MSAPRSALRVLAALIALSAAASACVTSWTPPPPEFANVALGPGGIDLPLTKWEPALGAASSLLDVLPAGSPAVADFNGDGFPDVFVPEPRYTNATLEALRAPHSRLYMNVGSTSGLDGENFVDVTAIAGIDVAGFAYGAAWGDYDNDGSPDLLVTGYHFARLFHNEGNATFRDVTAASGIPQGGLVLGGAWGDFDRDGRLDLALAEFTTDAPPPGAVPDLHALAGRANVLLRNEGNGTFRDVSAASGIGGAARRSTSAAFVDVDGDGRLDLSFTDYGEPAEVWLNDGDGTFTERASDLGLGGAHDATCQAWEDFDRDGRLDLFVAHGDGASDSLFLARGATFADASAALGENASDHGRAWGCVAFDYDADGAMDLAVAHTELLDPMRERPLLLRNDLALGAGLHFTDVTLEAGNHDIPGYTDLPTIAPPQSLSGLVAIDWALKGTPDLVASPSDGSGLALFKNVGWAGGWAGGGGDFFKVFLRGTASPAGGLGALVTVSAGNISVTREAGAAGSWGGGSATELQFGLAKDRNGGYCGEARPVSVTIRWPSGRVESYPRFFNTDRSARFTEGAGYMNDTLAPQPTLSLVAGEAGLHGWYTSASVTLRATALDNRLDGGSAATGLASLRASLDGRTWTDVPSPTTTGATFTFSGDAVHKLWLATADKTGNRAVFLFPVGIDTVAPSLAFASPLAGGVYAQGRELVRSDVLALLGRAFVLAPAPADATTLAGSPQPLLDRAADSDGRERVEANASDAGSGVWRVSLTLDRANGTVPPDGTATLRLPPFAWAWAANRTAAGEYTLVANASDFAGHVTLVREKVWLVPTTTDGVIATRRDGASPPTP